MSKPLPPSLYVKISEIIKPYKGSLQWQKVHI
jgi:hypothetical protein